MICSLLKIIKTYTIASAFYNIHGSIFVDDTKAPVAVSMVYDTHSITIVNTKDFVPCFTASHPTMHNTQTSFYKNKKDYVIYDMDAIINIPTHLAGKLIPTNVVSSSPSSPSSSSSPSSPSSRSKTRTLPPPPSSSSSIIPSILHPIASTKRDAHLQKRDDIEFKTIKPLKRTGIHVISTSTNHVGVVKDHQTKKAGVAKTHPTKKAGVAKTHPTKKAGVTKTHPTKKVGITKTHPTKKAGVTKTHPTKKVVGVTKVAVYKKTLHTMNDKNDKVIHHSDEDDEDDDEEDDEEDEDEDEEEDHHEIRRRHLRYIRHHLRRLHHLRSSLRSRNKK
jgi:hypothetical protein